MFIFSVLAAPGADRLLRDLVKRSHIGRRLAVEDGPMSRRRHRESDEEPRAPEDPEGAREWLAPPVRLRVCISLYRPR